MAEITGAHLNTPNATVIVHSLSQRSTIRLARPIALSGQNHHWGVLSELEPTLEGICTDLAGLFGTAEYCKY